MVFDLPADSSDAIVYLNGSFLPMREARIPVLDRGFIFGDGVYEVIPVYARQPFRLPEHLQRLQNSLDGIRLANPHSAQDWSRLVYALIARCPHQDQSFYLQVTRGVARRDHAFPKAAASTVFMMSNALSLPTREAVDRGVAAVSAIDNRWLRCDIKATALLANVLLRQIAVDAGASETILFRDGCLTEGAASNIFVVRDGELLAPPKSNLMLPGITYDVVLELAREASVRVQVRAVTEQEVREAQELWMTSATREVLAISTLDGKPVGAGQPGPMFQRIYAMYQAYKQAACAGTAKHA
jgi:D-alanine transaminase